MIHLKAKISELSSLIAWRIFLINAGDSSSSKEESGDENSLRIGRSFSW